MAAELRDLRLKITVETEVWLDGRERVTGTAKQEIVRDLLHKLALTAIEEAIYITKRAAVEGISGQTGAKP